MTRKQRVRLIQVIEALDKATPKPSPVPPISLPAFAPFPAHDLEPQTVLIVDDEEAILGICRWFSTKQASGP